MNTQTLSINKEAVENYNLYKFSGYGIITYVVLMLAASLSLVFVFNFPDILREPVEVMLQKFNEGRDLIIPSYYLFVMSGIVFVFMSLFIYKAVGTEQKLFEFLAVVSGVLFGVLSNLGFIRWPFLVSFFSSSLNDALTTESQKETLKIVFDSFHNYAGVAVGENFAFWFEGFWVICISLVIKSRKDIFPNHLYKIGMPIGIAMLIYTLEQFGGVFGLLGFTNVIIHSAFLMWLMAIAILLLKYNFNKNYKPELGKLPAGLLITGFVILLVTAFG